MQGPVLRIDFETRSACDLKKTGTHIYADDPTTDVLCAAWAIDDGPVFLWKRGDPCPEELREHVLAWREMRAWNASFERALWRVMERRYGWPAVPLTSWRCSMVEALAMSLPGSLENAAGAIGLTISKDMAGQRLMLQLAKPRRMEGSKPVWWETEEKLDKLYSYCKQDVVVEREISKRLLKLPKGEQTLWFLDQLVNDRGIGVDMELARGMKTVIAEAQEKFDKRLSDITDTDVTSATQVSALVRWIKAQGVEVDSLTKDKLGEILAGDGLPDKVRAALEIRQLAAKASVAKVDALVRGKSADGRARGTMQFFGASTGRWSGRRFQPQNLRRPNEDDDISGMIDLLRQGKTRWVEEKYGNPLDVTSRCLRGLVVPAAGRYFMLADFSNIEGRVLAWLAGEHWKLQAFRDYDTIIGVDDKGAPIRKGEDLYKITASRVIGKPVKEVTKGERQAQGKVPELALGFQGGPGAFAAMAKAFGVDITASYERLAAQDPAITVKCHTQYALRGKRTGMSERAWVSAEIIKIGWRAANPAIVAYWKLLEDMARQAVLNKGETVRGGRVAFLVRGSFLWMRLPSGRALCYPYPKIVDKPWDSEDPDSSTKPTLSYMGVDSFTKKWGVTYGHGGLLAENVTQAVARDVLAEALVRVETAGYPVVMHVHDEVICEPPIGFGSTEDFDRLMRVNPEWASGLPIYAESEQADRYKK